MSFFGLRWLPGFAADAADLLLRATRGDSAALDALYRQESGPVYRYALALCGNEAWAADALQDAFVALLHQPTGFDAAKGSLGFCTNEKGGSPYGGSGARLEAAQTSFYVVIGRRRKSSGHLVAEQWKVDGFKTKCGKLDAW